MLKVRSTFEVAKLHSPSRKEFEERFFSRRLPVVISGGMEGWPAATRWTNEYLKATAGERTIRVSTAHDGSHFFDGKEKILDHSSMKFGDYVDLVTSERIADGRLYAATVPIEKALPELWGDVRLPAYYDPARSSSVNLWFGPGNHLSPLHYDGSYNFLAQIRGSKQIVLSPPREIENLYPFPVNYASHHVSRVNVADPNPLKFPDYQRAERSLVELAPGDMLFIPFFWWHGVYSLEQNIAINFWWRPRPAEYLLYPRHTARGLGGRTITKLRGTVRRLARRAGIRRGVG